MSAFPIGTKLPEDSTVEVFEPCACATCAAGARWFMCPHIHERMVAKYASTSVVECVDREEGLIYTREGYPSEESIVAIRALHPGKTLVYLS